MRDDDSPPPRRPKHHHIRRDELPEELRPLFDQLTFEIHRVAHDYAVVHRLRWWQQAALGGLVVAVIINIVPAIIRAL